MRVHKPSPFRLNQLSSPIKLQLGLQSPDSLIEYYDVKYSRWIMVESDYACDAGEAKRILLREPGVKDDAPGLADEVSHLPQGRTLPSNLMVGRGRRPPTLPRTSHQASSSGSSSPVCVKRPHTDLEETPQASSSLHKRPRYKVSYLFQCITVTLLTIYSQQEPVSELLLDSDSEEFPEPTLASIAPKLPSSQPAIRTSAYKINAASQPRPTKFPMKYTCDMVNFCTKFEQVARLRGEGGLAEFLANYNGIEVKSATAFKHMRSWRGAPTDILQKAVGAGYTEAGLWSIVVKAAGGWISKLQTRHGGKFQLKPRFSIEDGPSGPRRHLTAVSRAPTPSLQSSSSVQRTHSALENAPDMPIPCKDTNAIVIDDDDSNLSAFVNPHPSTTGNQKNFDNGFDFDDAPAVVELDLQTVEQPVNITNDLNDELDYVTLSTSMDFDNNVKDEVRVFAFLCFKFPKLTVT